MWSGGRENEAVLVAPSLIMSQSRFTSILNNHFIAFDTCTNQVGLWPRLFFFTQKRESDNTYYRHGYQGLLERKKHRIRIYDKYSHSILYSLPRPDFLLIKKPSSCIHNYVNECVKMNKSRFIMHEISYLINTVHHFLENKESE